MTAWTVNKKYVELLESFEEDVRALKKVRIDIIRMGEDIATLEVRMSTTGKEIKKLICGAGRKSK